MAAAWIAMAGSKDTPLDRAESETASCVSQGVAEGMA